MKSSIKVIDMTDTKEFQNECNQYLKAGFRLSSSSCGFINSEQYEFCTSYQAIFIREL